MWNCLPYDEGQCLLSSLFGLKIMIVNLFPLILVRVDAFWKVIFGCVLFLFCFPSNAQEMNITTYNSGNGLPVDMVKSSLRDRRGFVWLGADNGLLRFDGQKCVSVTNLPSPYVKGVTELSGGELLAITDLGVAQVFDAGDSIRTLVLLRGSPQQTDTTLFYPKSFYYDKHGILWLGEPNAIVRCTITSSPPNASLDKLPHPKSIRMKRFRFGAAFASQNFLRSFSFAESEDGSLLAIPEQGGMLFRYDPVGEQFLCLPNQKPTRTQFRSVSALLIRSDKSIWIGTDKGIFQTTLPSIGQALRWKKIADVPDISCLTDVSEPETVFAGTWFSGLYRINRTSPRPEKLNGSALSSIKELRVDSAKNLWVCSDGGLTLIKPNLLTHLQLPFQRPSIQHLCQMPDSSVLVTNGSDILALDSLPHGNALNSTQSISYRRILRHNPITGTILSSSFSLERPELRNNGWHVIFGTSQGFFGRLRQGVVRESQLLPIREQQSLFHLCTDSRGRIWALQQNKHEVICLLPSGNIERYGNSKGIISTVNVVREAPFGGIYAGGADSTLLYIFDEQQQRFRSLEIPLKYHKSASFFVNDLVVEHDSTVWLATTQGVLRYRHGTVDTIAVPHEIAKKNVSGIQRHNDSCILFTTESRLNAYVHDEIVSIQLQNENASNFITTFRNIVVDRFGRIVLGTTQGVILLPTSFTQFARTPKPKILSFNVNEISTLLYENEPEKRRYLSESFIRVGFASLVFPTNLIRHQTRLLSTETIPSDSSWSEATKETFVIIPSLKPGQYTLQIRSQQEGLRWSEPKEMSFTIYPHWYRTWWAFGAFALMFALLIGGILQWRTQQLLQRNVRLQHIISERTQEIHRQMNVLEEQAQQIELANTMLNEKNTQLEYLVIEKNEFLGIAAHDLKNPITSIKLIASMMQKYRDKITGDDVMKQMQKVEFTATRMEEIVTNLLDINAIESGALSLKAIECDIADTLKAIVEQYRMQADAKGISLIYNHVSSARVIVDPIRAWEVLDNLLSNAIKYSPLGKTIWMTITMKNPNEGAQSEAGDQHSVQIRIHDEGPGLSEEDMAKLFGKFARLSARPTAGEQSTGLGLSIVKKLVEAMNGKVWCESELGKGATFIVELPAVEG